MGSHYTLALDTELAKVCGETRLFNTKGYGCKLGCKLLTALVTRRSRHVRHDNIW